MSDQNIKGYRVCKADGTPIDEPCMVLRAQDVFALDAVEHYRSIVSRFHPDPSFVKSVGLTVELFRRWRCLHQNQVKIPD